MKKIYECRRSIISIISIGCLTYLGVSRGIDVSLAIAGICAAVCGANSYENTSIAKTAKGVDNAG